MRKVKDIRYFNVCEAILAILLSGCTDIIIVKDFFIQCKFN